MGKRDPDWSKVTKLLRLMSEGDAEAEARVFAVLYDHLRAQAARQMRDQRPGHLLRATALVHEAYIKLARSQCFEWESRGQFLAAASRAMRHVLVDHARAMTARKRCGGDRVPLDSLLEVYESAGGAILDLHAGIEDLFRNDPQAARVVELRFFAGLTIPETADALGVSRATVERDWAFARAWLAERLS